MPFFPEIGHIFIAVDINVVPSIKINRSILLDVKKQFNPSGKTFKN